MNEGAAEATRSGSGAAPPVKASTSGEATRRLTVEVQDDHLKSLCGTRSPLDSIAELIWNALDADAAHVRVLLIENGLGGLDEVVVTDDGHGIPHETALTSFGSLGGSWKPQRGKTPEGRFFHGKHGRGRYKAFSLGQSVRWETTFKLGAARRSYEIRSTPSLRTFEVTAPVPSREPTGTAVHVTSLLRDFRSLRADDAVQKLTEVFALYLSLYPRIEIIYNGDKVDPEGAVVARADLDLPAIKLDDGRTMQATLAVIEWRHPADRALYLCDEHGSTLEYVNAEIQAPGFNFTAYLKSALFSEKGHAILLAEMDPLTQPLIDAARASLKEHFRKRANEQTDQLVSSWKQEHVYPFDGEPQGPIESAEREVFDQIAITVSKHMPSLAEVDRKSRQLTLSLLRQALETSPRELRQIIEKVLDLPKDKREEFAQLLEKMTLPAIITASRTVADRLEFLKGLEALLFAPDLRPVFRERSQLHRILTKHTWVFGEEFNLSIDDQSLEEVLRQHLKLLGRPVGKVGKVAVDGRTRGIVDLMLSQVIPLPRAQERWHLVVELKRPKDLLALKHLDQIKAYARAVASDQRFSDTSTRWDFVLLGNELGADVQREARQRDRTPGLAYDDSEQRIRVWVRSWGEVIQEASARLRFYQERLAYDPSREQGLGSLRARHPNLLPVQAGGTVVKMKAKVQTKAKARPKKAPKLK